MAHIITLPALLLISSLATAANAEPLPALPEPVADSVVLQSAVRGKLYILSSGGSAQSSTTANNTGHRKSWLLTLGESSWQPLSDIPSAQGANGRVSAAAVSLDQQFFIFGGRGTGRNGQAVTLTDSYRLSPIGKMYQKLPDMPVAVYDSVALTYANRYIYLLGGSHQGNAVNLIQIFDNFTQKWSQATPYPVAAVSRHSAVLADNRLLVCGGVRQAVDASGQIAATAQTDCYLAAINPAQPAQLNWQRLSTSPGILLDAAAVAATVGGKTKAAFIGGRSALNSNTINQSVWLFDFEQQNWQQLPLTSARGDSRYLLNLLDGWYSLGGTDAAGVVSASFANQQFSLLPAATP